MRNLIWVLIGLSALGLLLAVINVLFHVHFLGVTAEGYSRVCSNLALISIALHLVTKEKKV
ncbi:MAG TPA: hypothetical protein ENN20_00015 [Candidatus Marinimicrobia bacterium]|nr:hypothetical protein [Candidatus Neomarinimicrobiota bacterium]